MRVTLHYTTPVHGEEHQIEGDLVFGDALLNEYMGVRNDEGVHLIPGGLVLRIFTSEFDSDLYEVDVESVRASKHLALKRINAEQQREKHPRSGFHG